MLLPSRYRDRVVNTTFALLAVAGGTVALATVNTPRWWYAPDIVLGFVALGLLALRKRYPVSVAVITTLLSVVSAAAAGPALLATFSAVVHRSARIALALLAFAIATLPPTLLIRPSEDQVFWDSMLQASLFCGIVVAWGMFVHSRRELVASLEERADRAEREQQMRVDQARQAERARIAREMHDVMAHRISLVSMHAGALEFRSDAPPEEVQRAAGVIRSSAHQALEELREVIGVLREHDDKDAPDGDTPEPPQPTAGDLPALVRETEAAGVKVHLDTDGVELGDVPKLTGRTAYRVVQEGLTNARKHAPAATVDVTLSGDPSGGLSVEVRNPLSVNGANGDVPGTGTGLVGLVERASLAGGRLEHGRTPEGHYRLAAWLPWQ